MFLLQFFSLLHNKNEDRLQEQAQEQAKKPSLHQLLRKAKKARDKIAILEAALEAAKIKALEDEKTAEEKKVNKDRRLRAKHLYSLGVAVEYLARRARPRVGAAWPSLRALCR